MKETLYIPIIIISSIYRNFFIHLANAIEEFQTPEGVKIIKVYDSSDRLMNYIFTQVENMNEDRITSPHFRTEPETMLEIEFETDKPIRYQQLSWLDDQIKDVIRNYHDTVGLYFFYLVEGGKRFHSPNFAKTYSDEGINFIDDDTSDDISALNEKAPFLNCLWYNGEKLIEAFPSEVAKYLLIFG